MSSKNLLTISDLERRAKGRIPFYAWEYLDSGTGAEDGLHRNCDAFSKITMVPQFMKGELSPDVETELFGIRYAAPFGVAPMGLSSLMWPRAELILAEMAGKRRIPYGLSTVATHTPEDVGPRAKGMGWFQLYPPRDGEMRRDLLKRARDSGFTACMVTADVPIGSRRERQKRADLSVPPNITARMLYWSAIRPSWCLATLKAGKPRFRALERYVDDAQMTRVMEYIGQNLGGTLSWDYLAETRDEWDGPLLVKGLMHPEDVEKSIGIGADGIVVSNHGARQFDGAPAAIDVLPDLVETVGGRAKIVFDSGVRSGLDIARALALGADFVLLGRAFMFGVAALGEKGAEHVFELLDDDLKNNMVQLGCARLDELSTRLPSAIAKEASGAVFTQPSLAAVPAG